MATRADLVGYSFVRTVTGVHALQRELARLCDRDLGIVLKIETRKAFESSGVAPGGYAQRVVRRHDRSRRRGRRMRLRATR
jgi:hypothetical protein